MTTPLEELRALLDAGIRSLDIGEGTKLDIDEFLLQKLVEEEQRVAKE
jgi:hypothetical protein